MAVTETNRFRRYRKKKLARVVTVRVLKNGNSLPPNRQKTAIRYREYDSFWFCGNEDFQLETKKKSLRKCLRKPWKTTVSQEKIVKYHNRIRYGTVLPYNTVL